MRGVRSVPAEGEYYSGVMQAASKLRHSSVLPAAGESRASRSGHEAADGVSCEAALHGRLRRRHRAPGTTYPHAAVLDGTCFAVRDCLLSAALNFIDVLYGLRRARAASAIDRQARSGAWRGGAGPRTHAATAALQPEPLLPPDRPPRLKTCYSTSGPRRSPLSFPLYFRSVS